MFLLLAFVSCQFSDISPDLYKNILKPEWGTNFKYNGQVNHNLDRVWVVTKIPIPRQKELNIKKLIFDSNCKKLADHNHAQSQSYSSARTTITAMCTALSPLVGYIQDKEWYAVKKINDWYTDELYRALPALESTGHRHKRAAGIISALSGLVTIGVEALSAHLQKKREKAITNAVNAMAVDTEMMKNRLSQFQDDMVLYGKYSVDSLEQSMKTLNSMHKRVNTLEQMVQGTNSALGSVNLKHTYGMDIFAFDLQLWFHHIQQEHDEIYQEVLRNLERLMKGIEKLSKGYLPSELFPPSKLYNITQEVLNTIRKSHSEYTLTIDQIGSYYDMKLVTFAVDQDHSLVVTFPIFIHPYRNRPLNLYEIETVPVPIPDTNLEADSYSQVTISKPYIAVNRNYYIQLRIQELRMCKQIKFDYYCEELFLVKHKAVKTCESALFFSKNNVTITQTCEFKYFYNTTIIPSVLDGGSQIVLANMVNSKKLTCSNLNNLGSPLPSYKYVTVPRSILCNCQIVSSLSYVLRSIGSCIQTIGTPKLLHTSNLAFQEIFNHLWLNSTPPPIYSEQEISYPIFLNSTPPEEYLEEPHSLKELKALVLHRQEQQHTTPANTLGTHIHHTPRENFKFLHTNTKSSNKTHTIFASVISSLVLLVLIAIVVLCLRHYKVKAIITGMSLLSLPSSSQATKALQSTVENTVVCTSPWITNLTVGLTIAGAAFYILRQFFKLKWLTGRKFDTYTNIYLVICRGQYYIPVKITQIQAPSFTLKQKGILTKEQTVITHNYIWDTISIDWKEVHFLHENKIIKVPNTLTIPFQDKIRFRFLTFQDTHNYFIIAKQGSNWISIQPERSSLAEISDTEE